MAQLFEKALIALIAIIAASIALSGLQYMTEEIGARMVAGTCEALASKLVEASYAAATLGRAEVVINSPAETTLTFVGERLTVSSCGYIVSRNLPMKAAEFSTTFSGQLRIVLEVRDGILWVGEA